MIAAVCADTSTCWPSPSRSRAVSAIRAPSAASAPACRNACGTVMRTGGRSASPVSSSACVDAQIGQHLPAEQAILVSQVQHAIRFEHGGLANVNVGARHAAPALRRLGLCTCGAVTVNQERARPLTPILGNYHSGSGAIGVA